MLRLIDITKVYSSGDSEVHALKGVSISFRKSEFVSILGHSGCGKTTLLNIVGGLDQYTSGDLEISGAVTGYDVKATAITANEQAAQNRLTVTVKISFTNRKYPEDDFPDKSFSAYADFDAMQPLDAVEASLCEEIIEQLCDDMFNATVANW